MFWIQVRCSSNVSVLQYTEGFVVGVIVVISFSDTFHPWIEDCVTASKRSSKQKTRLDGDNDGNGGDGGNDDNNLAGRPDVTYTVDRSLTVK